MLTNLTSVDSTPYTSNRLITNKPAVAETNITTEIETGLSSLGLVTATEVQTALDLILVSNLFINAIRRRRLLTFLVEKAISGTIRDTSEYCIGIEVFDRDPALYNTSADPIVRVQAGRLREKLKIYYDTLGADSDIEISIPVGSYMPIIRRKSAMCIDCKQCYLLAISPFKCISYHIDGVHFTQGLDEELKHQLFKTFGKIVVLNSAITSNSADHEGWTLKRVTDIGISHLLEGSVQINAENIRISIRLIKILESCVICSEQFDRHFLISITHQEEIAASICVALQNFFVSHADVMSYTGCQII